MTPRSFTQYHPPTDLSDNPIDSEPTRLAVNWDGMVVEI